MKLILGFIMKFVLYKGTRGVVFEKLNVKTDFKIKVGMNFKIHLYNYMVDPWP